MSQPLSRASLLLTVLTSINAFGQSYTITTVAGGGPASSSSGPILSSPQALAADSGGNLYIADSADHLIWKVLPGGAFTIFAGTGEAGFAGDGGSATLAELNAPRGVAVDATGNVYVADTGNNRVRVVAPDGTMIQTIAGVGSAGFSGEGGPASSAQLRSPQAVVLDASGDLFIADTGNNCVRLVANGVIQTVVAPPSATAIGIGDGGLASSARLRAPMGLALDSNGNLYIADTGDNAVRVVTKAHTVGPGGLAAAYQSGSIASIASGTAAGVNALSSPQGVSVDASGNVYIADTGNNRIVKVTTTQVGNGTTTVLYTNLGPGRSYKPTGYWTSPSAGAATVGVTFTATATGPMGTALLAVGSVNGSLMFDLYADCSPSGGCTGAPGALLESWTGVSVPSTGYDASSQRWALPLITLTSAVNPVLSAGRTYWLLATGNATTVPNTVSVFWDRGIVGTGGTWHSYSPIANTVNLTLSPPANPDNAPNALELDTATSLHTLTSLAGSGKPGFSGDGGSAAAASLSAPAAIARDNEGNLYVADSGNHVVRQIAPSGIINSLFSPGPVATAVGLANPGCVALDKAGNLFFADRNGAYRVVLATGQITKLAGPWAPLSSRPNGCAVDNQNNVYLADTSNSVVWEVSSAGVVGAVAGTPGQSGFSGDGGPSASALLNNPRGLALDRAGNVYIADNQNARIREVTTEGVIETIAGTGAGGFAGDGGPATAARLNAAGLAIDAAGTVYTSDASGCHVRMISPAGIITTVAGINAASACGYAGDGGPATSALLDSPIGLAADGNGNLYIAESTGNRIRKVDASGTITTIAGAGAAGFSGDGASALAAQLSSPNGLAADSADNVYIADAGTNRIRKLTPPPRFISGVVNAASLLPGAVSPGEIVTINGNGLGATQAASFQVTDAGTLSTTLAETQVMFDGTPAALLSVQASRITAMVPYEVAGEAATQIQVASPGGQSNTVAIPVGVAAPAIFTQDSSGTGPGMILNGDGSTNSPSNPAARQSVVTIQATGEGQTTPPGTDGLIASDTPPGPLQSVSLRIGGVTDGQIVSATGTPGLAAGYFQVAVKIPDDAPSGSAVPILLIVGGVASQAGVTISIQ